MSRYDPDRTVEEEKAYQAYLKQLHDNYEVEQEIRRELFYTFKSIPTVQQAVREIMEEVGITLPQFPSVPKRPDNK